MRWLLVCFLLFCSTSSFEDDRCADDPTSEVCRQTAQSDTVSSLPTPASVRKSAKEKTKSAVQTAETLAELLSVTRIFPGNLTPLFATALMSIRMPRALVNIPPPVGSKARPRKRVYLQLLLQAGAEGRLMISDALEGNLIWDTKSKVDISLLKVAGDRVAIAYSDNSVRVFKVSAFTEEKELLPGQKKKVKDVTPPILRLKLEPEAEVPPYVRSSPAQNAETPAVTADDAAAAAAAANDVPSQITALSMQVGKGRLQWLLAGYADGVVVSFNKEGIVKAETETNSSVVGLTTGQGTSVLVVNQQGCGVLRVSSRTSPLNMFCSHTQNGTVIRGVVYDPSSAAVLYAVTAGGRLLVFNMKSSRDPNVYCRPKHSVVVEEGAELSIVATKGFLLLTSPSALYIYNLTVTRAREAPSFTFRHTFIGDKALLPPSFVSLSLSPSPSGNAASSFETTAAAAAFASSPLSLDILHRETTDEYIAVSHLASGETVVFTSHLPFTEESKGSTMYRLPILLGGVVAMAVFQMYKKRKPAMNMNDPMMRELREIGKTTNRLEPQKALSRGMNRRFGLTGRRPPTRLSESPPPIYKEEEDQSHMAGYLSDPEEMLNRLGEQE